MHGTLSFVDARASQAGVLAATLPHLLDQLHGWAPTLRGPGPVLVGMGASLAASGAATWLLRRRGVNAHRVDAADTPLPLPSGEQPVVAISQGGGTAETLAVLRSVPTAWRHSVVNNAGPISEISARTLSLGAVADSYASTIGYTATVTALGLLAETWGPTRSEPDPGWWSLPDAVAALDAELPRSAPDLAALLAGSPVVDVVGAAPSLGTAELGCLMLREVAQLPAMAASTRRYLHGLIESAGRPGTVLIFGDGPEIATARLLTEAGSRVVLVTSRRVEPAALLHPVIVEPRPAGQRQVLEALVVQHLAEQAAVARGVAIEEFAFFKADYAVPPGPEEIAT